MAANANQNDDHEVLRRMKLEVALEVKSLRRIISAYLKYGFSLPSYSTLHFS